MVSNAVRRDARFFGTIARKTGFQTRSILCIALHADARLLGANEVLNAAASDGFGGKDLRLLEVFSRLAAPSISLTKTLVAVGNVKTAFQDIVQDRYQLVDGSRDAMHQVS